MSVEVNVEGRGRVAFEVALREFTRQVGKAELLAEARRRRYFTPPSVERRRRRTVKRAKSRKNGAAQRLSDAVPVRASGYLSMREEL